MIDVDRFIFRYSEAFSALKESQEAGLRFLLEQLFNDRAMVDPRWIAYCLATTKHECADRWQPIAEYGKGKGKKYGIADEQTGQTYYGRGYVQLTWKANYQTMAKLTGADLVNSPDLAMTPEIAYKILSSGMRNGYFTGVKLATYINGDKCDYLHARKIINGMDCAERIAAYAVKFAKILDIKEAADV
jgi:predicted chitinase